MNESILQVKNVKKYFPVSKGVIFLKQVGLIKAVDDISFNIGKGETFGLVGESGCGKTTTAKLILLMEEITSGTIIFEDKNIVQQSEEELVSYKNSVKAVFQDPYSSLNPRMRVGSILAEPLVVNDILSRQAIKDRVAELIQLVGLRADSHELYPHEFSGGQRQRIAVARSLALNPKLIVLDEPVSALDISIRAQIMNLLNDLQYHLGLTYLLIAHDLAVVKHMSKRIGVMYLGKLVEVAESEELYRHRFHPYTEALLSAALPDHPDIQQDEIILPEEVPSPLNPPSGCRFHPRCFNVTPTCSEEEPELKDVGGGHYVACHLTSQPSTQ